MTAIDAGSAVLPWNPEPSVAARLRYPYLVVRLMSAVFQREDITLHPGSPSVHIGHRDTFVHHPQPFDADGAVSADCRALLIAGTLEAVQRTRFRMCLVWAADSCTFVEFDGSVKHSDDPPSGGLGTGGVGGKALPGDIEFDRRAGQQAKFASDGPLRPLQGPDGCK